MNGPAHAHAHAHGPNQSAHAHESLPVGNAAGPTVTAPLTQRSRPSRPLTLTIPPPFKGGIREQPMTGGHPMETAQELLDEAASALRDYWEGRLPNDREQTHLLSAIAAALSAIAQTLVDAQTLVAER